MRLKSCTFGWLYLIEILHQTTTVADDEPEVPELYLIEILHQTTTFRPTSRIFVCCILSKFYIKPQQQKQMKLQQKCCILSKFYIKPQRYTRRPNQSRVVSYRNSTSNHNYPSHAFFVVSVVSYRNSTSNHNFLLKWYTDTMLYLIEILHQTTTPEK